MIPITSKWFGGGSDLDCCSMTVNLDFKLSSSFNVSLWIYSFMSVFHSRRFQKSNNWCLTNLDLVWPAENLLLVWLLERKLLDFIIIRFILSYFELPRTNFVHSTLANLVLFLHSFSLYVPIHLEAPILSQLPIDETTLEKPKMEFKFISRE